MWKFLFAVLCRGGAVGWCRCCSPGISFWGGRGGEHPGVPGLLAGKALTCWNVGWEGWIVQLLLGNGRENCWRGMGIITFRLQSGCMD